MNVSDNPVKIYCTPNTKRVTVPQRWFLPNPQDSENVPVECTFKPLINGELTFSTLYEKIKAAKSSVDIAIWGFQPSMFFKRSTDNNTDKGENEPEILHCIGELLMKKALEGVKVRILVWSLSVMTLKHMQTWGEFGEANLGNFPMLYSNSKVGVEGVTQEQLNYDYLWYQAIQGMLTGTEPYPGFGDHNLLLEFNKLPSHENLRLKLRFVADQQNTYLDKDLPELAKMVLSNTASHHQKTVLIDYESPDNAVGFVLEHNMIDNYWDTSKHVKATATFYTGRNHPTPYQDVSSIVTGPILYYINQNFCQSWDRDSNMGFGYSAKNSPSLTAARADLKPSNFSPNPINGEGGIATMGQILRTYDMPDVEDIKKMYLRNITLTTSYIYTENQYFRWPPLVETFIDYWENGLKAHGRPPSKPIHWFVVTTSSNEGLGKGTYTTNRMLKLLGRQDVMPNVATNVELIDLAKTDTIKGLNIDDKDSSEIQEELEGWVKQNTELRKKAEEAKKDPKILYRDLSESIGIKAHICTLTAADAWLEVYIHSKVTIIDDVFTFIGSANLNTRSMQVDTELGIITECSLIATDLRKALWALHTGNDELANPNDMHNYENAKKAFEQWQMLINDNKKEKEEKLTTGINNGKPKQQLCEFLRLDPSVTSMD